MSDFSRREWLERCLSVTGAAFAAQLPPQFSTPAPPPCDPSTKPTPARVAAGYRPDAPMRREIPASPGGLAVTINGAVIGLRCGFVPGAVVNFWLGSEGGRQLTDANGRFSVTLTVPKGPRAVATHVGLRVEVPKKATLRTYLFLPDEIAKAENTLDPTFDPLLRMKLAQQSASGIQAAFDVILDL